MIESNSGHGYWSSSLPSQSTWNPKELSSKFEFWIVKHLILTTHQWGKVTPLINIKYCWEVKDIIESTVRWYVTKYGFFSGGRIEWSFLFLTFFHCTQLFSVSANQRCFPALKRPLTKMCIVIERLVIPSVA